MYQHLTKLHLAGLVAAFGFAGRRLSVLVLSLAIVLALAGVTQAKKPEGTPGGPPNGDDGGPLKYSQFSAPLVDALSALEIPSSLAEIDNRGNWSLTTTDLVAGERYDICLDAFSGPGPLPLLLGTFQSPDDNLATGINGPLTNVDGNWQGPSFQVFLQAGSPCTGAIIQESGIQSTGGVSKFSAPFVALKDGILIGEVESTAQISGSGDWILVTSGLKRRQRYDICLFDPVVPRTIFLQDRRSRANGNLYANGNALTRGFTGTWQALSFQIMEEPEDFADNCDDVFLVQESGIEINAP